ncbi:hypothetical protein H0N95_00430 [Candidatus Micrarchaeota archaeon]|nr:hypothetical protein [Candidatus Micrarchaeota archaeon]
MNNRAQVSTEYLIMAAVLILLTVVLAALAVNIFTAKESIKEQARILTNGVSEMVE